MNGDDGSQSKREVSNKREMPVELIFCRSSIVSIVRSPDEEKPLILCFSIDHVLNHTYVAGF
jgi:formate dehydrogenase assembly factor FdhD